MSWEYERQKNKAICKRLRQCKWKNEKKKKRIKWHMGEWDNEIERKKKEQSNIWVTDTMEIKEKERKSTYERRGQWQSKTKYMGEWDNENEFNKKKMTYERKGKLTLKGGK